MQKKFLKFGYDLVEQNIGEGGTGIVSLVSKTQLDNNNEPMKILYAIKTINQKQSSQFYSQIRLLKNMSHPHIVQTYQHYEDFKKYYIVMEYCEKNIRKLIFDEKRLEVKMGILSMIVLGVKYLHQSKIAHRDLKPQNIMLQNGIIKIVDFGLSKLYENSKEQYSRSIVTLHYSAYQLYKGLQCDEKVDIWSLGIIFLQLISNTSLRSMLTGKNQEPPCVRPEFPKKQYLDKIDNLKIRKMVINMLQKDKKKRINIHQVWEIVKIYYPKYAYQEQTDNNLIKRHLIFLQNGDFYEGEMNLNKIHGKGIYHFKNGNRYVGFFKDGLCHGYGSFYLRDKCSYQTKFNDGIQIQKGVLFMDNKRKRYEGLFLNGENSFQNYGSQLKNQIQLKFKDLKFLAKITQSNQIIKRQNEINKLKQQQSNEIIMKDKQKQKINQVISSQKWNFNIKIPPNFSRPISPKTDRNNIKIISKQKQAANKYMKFKNSYKKLPETDKNKNKTLPNQEYFGRQKNIKQISYQKWNFSIKIPSNFSRHISPKTDRNNIKIISKQKQAFKKNIKTDLLYKQLPEPYKNKNKTLPNQEQVYRQKNIQEKKIEEYPGQNEKKIKQEQRLELIKEAYLKKWNQIIVCVENNKRIAQMKVLDLSHKKIKQISKNIGYLTSLTKFQLHHNQISNISQLSPLTSLIELSLQHNSISDISPISTLTLLNKLWLNDNSIVIIESLSKLTSLVQLYLQNNKISNILPIGSLLSLTILNLNNNQIRDISCISQLLLLNQLNLHDNKIKEIESINTLRSLKQLSLYNNFIIDITPLIELTYLRDLDLCGNNLLASFQNLQIIQYLKQQGTYLKYDK